MIRPIPLAAARTGTYRIVGVRMPGIARKLTSLGVFTGDTVEVIKAAPGPVIFLKGSIRIGIGRGMAFHIMVETVATETP